MGELNFYGVYVPVLLIQALLAYILLRLLMRVLDRFVEQGWIALPNIFYLCVYLVLLWLVHWGFIVCLG
jgi:predicted benzoate:H+ symporter BenE